MRRLVVVGGGPAGLTAAWAARQVAIEDGVPLDIVVLERDGEVGGKARTRERDRWRVECGPSGFLGGRPTMDRVIDTVGIRGDVVPASPASKRRFIWRAGALRRVSPNPVALMANGLLSPGGLLRLLREPWIPVRDDASEESVWDFAVRRLGKQAADRLVRPMMLGVFAAEPEDLGVEAAFPRMKAVERAHGSLIRGLISRGRLSGIGGLSSFREGMQTYARALASRGGFDVHRRRPVTRLVHQASGGWTAIVDDGSAVEADAVILATEPWAMAPLVEPLLPEVARELRAIRTPPIAVVALGYTGEAARRIPEGLGVLASRGQGIRALGHIWESRLYPGRGPDGGVLVRAIFGGRVDAGVVTSDDDELVRLAARDVRAMYGIAEPPTMREVIRWDRALPQYEVGHAVRVQRIEGAVRRLPGLALTGWSLRATGFADVVTHAAEVGAATARRPDGS